MPTFPDELVELTNSFVPLQPDPFIWDIRRKDPLLWVELDEHRALRVVRNTGETWWRSIRSREPLNVPSSCYLLPPRSSSSSSPLLAAPSGHRSIASFRVRMDRVTKGCVHIGIAQEDWNCAESENAYAGFVGLWGEMVRKEAECGSGEAFGQGDIIEVQLDLDKRRLTFFKNNVSQRATFADLDLRRPVYAAISLLYAGDTVTMLDHDSERKELRQAEEVEMESSSESEDEGDEDEEKEEEEDEGEEGVKVTKVCDIVRQGTMIMNNEEDDSSDSEGTALPVLL